MNAKRHANHWVMKATKFVVIGMAIPVGLNTTSKIRLTQLRVAQDGQTFVINAQQIVKHVHVQEGRWVRGGTVNALNVMQISF